MRISDWSSDVCSSDLPAADNTEGKVQEEHLVLDQALSSRFLAGTSAVFGLRPHEAVLAAVGLGLAEWSQGPLAWELEGHGRQPFDPAIDLSRSKIGRASGRESVCQYV